MFTGTEAAEHPIGHTPPRLLPPRLLTASVAGARARRPSAVGSCRYSSPRRYPRHVPRRQAGPRGTLPPLRCPRPAPSGRLHFARHFSAASHLRSFRTLALRSPSAEPARARGAAVSHAVAILPGTRSAATLDSLCVIILCFVRCRLRRCVHRTPRAWLPPSGSMGLPASRKSGFLPKSRGEHSSSQDRAAAEAC